MSRPEAPRWLSADPGNAWAERFFLAYSPVWIAAVATVQLPGVMDSWRDQGYLLFSVLVMLPLWLYPLLRPGVADRGKPFWRTHWFRFNVWVAIYTWVGSYFVSHYFFTYMGMRYQFPVEWMLDAAIAGEGDGEVPIFMVPLTHAYFITYHVGLVVCLRQLRTRFRPPWWALVPIIVALSFAVAFAETFAMANPLLEQYFGYASRCRMLTLGSTFYALLFVVSLPMLSRLDEPDPWPMGRVVTEALAAGMLALILLDAWALVIGPI